LNVTNNANITQKLNVTGQPWTRVFGNTSQALTNSIATQLSTVFSATTSNTSATGNPTYSSGVITINTAGTYLVIHKIAMVCTSNNSNFETWIEISGIPSGRFGNTSIGQHTANVRNMPTGIFLTGLAVGNTLTPYAFAYQANSSTDTFGNSEIYVVKLF